MRRLATWAKANRVAVLLIAALAIGFAVLVLHHASGPSHTSGEVDLRPAPAIPPPIGEQAKPDAPIITPPTVPAERGRPSVSSGAPRAPSHPPAMGEKGHDMDDMDHTPAPSQVRPSGWERLDPGTNGEKP